MTVWCGVWLLLLWVLLGLLVLLPLHLLYGKVRLSAARMSGPEAVAGTSQIPLAKNHIVIYLGAMYKIYCSYGLWLNLIFCT